ARERAYVLLGEAAGGVGLPVVGGKRSTAGLTLGDLDAVAGHLEQTHRGLVDRTEPLVLDAAREQLHGPGLTAATGMPQHRPATVGEGTDTGHGAAEPSRDQAGETELLEHRQ